MDKHFTQIEIAGKSYPLNYSIRASRKFAEMPKLGGDSLMQDVFEQNVRYLYILMEEGADYRKRFLGEPGELGVTEEDLYNYFSPNDTERIVGAVDEAMKAGNQREVSAKPGKNAGAAAGEEKAKAETWPGTSPGAAS